MQPAIRINNLGKEYRLSLSKEWLGYRTLRDSLAQAASRVLHIARGTRTQSHAEKFWALQDINFDVQPGEVVGIIGRNGAGKSTLLKILSRITRPTTGRAEMRGRLGSLLEVGTGFHPELTGRENIFLNGAILGMKKLEIKSKFDGIAAFAEIDNFLDTPVKRYSSGMYVRLAFAVAAHLEPEVLVVDEVLAVGDAAFQKKCLNKMQDIGKEGRTVLFVSHNMPAVTRLCGRAVWLAEGKVVNDGPVHQVTSLYMRSGSGTTAVREWPDLATAPGDDNVRLCAVRIRNKKDKISETHDIREPVRVEIEYHNFRNDLYAYANVMVYDEVGNYLFCSGDFVNRAWRHEPRRFTGRVRSTCTIPGNLLAEGQITISVALTTHNPSRILALERDAVAFLVVDGSQGDGARGEYAGAFPGIIRPLLDWQIEQGAPASS